MLHDKNIHKFEWISSQPNKTYTRPIWGNQKGDVWCRLDETIKFNMLLEDKKCRVINVRWCWTYPTPANRLQDARATRTASDNRTCNDNFNNRFVVFTDPYKPLSKKINCFFKGSSEQSYFSSGESIKMFGRSY